eukprot:1191156-Amphidinium_carterae.1
MLLHASRAVIWLLLNASFFSKDPSGVPWHTIEIDSQELKREGGSTAMLNRRQPQAHEMAHKRSSKAFPGRHAKRKGGLSYAHEEGPAENPNPDGVLDRKAA